MGSDRFIQMQDGTDAKAAFIEAARQAAYEHGSGGYTGSLAEKGDFSIISRQPLWQRQAELVADRLLASDDVRISDKWGPAGALAVCKETYDQDVSVSGTPHSDWDALIAEAVTLRRGEMLAGSRLRCSDSQRFGGPETRMYTVSVKKAGSGVRSSEELTLSIKGAEDGADLQATVDALVRAKYANRSGVEVDGFSIRSIEAKTKLVATTNTGRTTRYVVKGRCDNDVSSYATLAEAKKAARELASQPVVGFAGPSRYRVQAVVCAGDGGALFEVVGEVQSRRVVVQVDVVRGRKAAPTADAWLFFGWASC